MTEGKGLSDDRQEGAAPSADGDPTPFRHPQWLVGVVLIFGVAALVAGLQNPIWFVIGFPCILVLVVWLWVRWTTSR